MVFNVQFEKL